MKQVMQDLRDGSIEVLEVPIPAVGPGVALVRVAASLVSAGTERAAIEFGRQNLLQKARSRPHLVKQVLEKVARDGVVATARTVMNRLGSMNNLGYSCAGTIIETGSGVTDVRPGDLVACAGAGYASHAEYVAVPRNLIVRIPKSDPSILEDAAFSTLGAIALQGIRLGNSHLGEAVAVIGLGLLGQITIQLLKAAGCTVLGFDPIASRAALALQLGADSAAQARSSFVGECARVTTGFGVDTTLITAATTSNEPIQLAGEITRDKGRVVAVGDVGLTIPRRPYFQKELEFVISRSYGPGRYDPSYEEHGNDYPYGYVRWTEKRNMQAFVDMLVRGSVRMQPLITHRFPIHEAPAAYDLIAGKSGEPYLGILIKYPDDAALTHRVEIRSAKARNAQPMARRIGLGVVGAGGFVTDKLLPAFSKLDGIDLVGLANRTALSTRNVAQRFHFRYAASDLNELIGDPTVDLVLIGTPHGLHASQVVTALQAGKHVFVEKPLCLKLEELEEIQKALDSSPGRMLMVGFNRRFAPLARRLADAIRDRHEPLVVHYRVNAGYLPPDHWTQDPAVGGGRLLGEGCHFLDWMFWLTGSPAVGVYTTAMNDAGRYRADNFMTQIGFLDGSVGTLTYVANGSRLSGKERVEVYCEGQTLILNDFQHLEIARPGKLRLATTQLRAIDKGHAEECRLTVAALREGTSWPIPIADIVHSTRITLAAQASIHSGTPVRL